MKRIDITHIGILAGTFNPQQPLRGSELATLPCLPNAWLRVENDRIHSFGLMTNYQADPAAEMVNAAGGIVLPCWCDSHTHIVFPASREEEFVDKIRGRSYAEIAQRGGGILNSAGRLAMMSEDELFDVSWKRVMEVISLGTGALEIKSGYGLTTESELKMLRVIRRIREKATIPVKATFLGAHAFPAQYRDDHEGYLRLIIEEMLPAIARENLADYIDVFCEKGFFSPEETLRICQAGMEYGLKPRLHANQLSLSGGVQTGVALGAISVDHLETMDAETIRTLAGSDTIGTLLPTAAFFLRMPFQPAREIIDGGCRIALASDFNPGSSPSGNMNLVVSMACAGMRMLPEEALNAATINGAFAMEIAGDYGSIAGGKIANIILTKPAPSLAYLPYAFGSNHIDRVMIGGQWV
jgi:imidazolonepropionase